MEKRVRQIMGFAGGKEKRLLITSAFQLKKG